VVSASFLLPSPLALIFITFVWRGIDFRRLQEYQVGFNRRISGQVEACVYIYGVGVSVFFCSSM